MHLAELGHRFDATPQTEQADPREVQNNAGGFVFAVDEWTRLDRFCILGTAEPTYYTDARKLTKDNFAHVSVMIKAHGVDVVKRVVDISVSGRAAKQEYAIFVLAMCAGAEDVDVRRAALDALPKVCRTGSTLLLFASYVEQFRGWGPTLCDGIRNWYNGKDVSDRLAYQVLKYQNRYGWTHRDLLRLAHVNPIVTGEPSTFNSTEVKPYSLTSERDRLYAWITGKKDAPTTYDLPIIVKVYERAHAAKEIDFESLDDLTHEMIPTDWKKSGDVWTKLLGRMPLTAMIRNLATMTVSGALAPGSPGAHRVVSALGDAEHLRKSRVHPAAILTALAVYRSGKGIKGSQTWIPTPEVVQALDAAFYLAFPNVVPAGKRTLIGLDVSGSMEFPLSALPALSSREATAALAMLMVATEPEVQVYGFTANERGYGGHWSKGEPNMTQIPMHRGQHIPDVCSYVARLPMGGTDCATPMNYALANRIPVDTFVIMTDNETWAGNIHPMEALRKYRREMGIPARLAVIGTTATEFSIADPDDAGTMDFVGFDAALPIMLNDFSRGGPHPHEVENEG